MLLQKSQKYEAYMHRMMCITSCFQLLAHTVINNINNLLYTGV